MRLNVANLMVRSFQPDERSLHCHPRLHTSVRLLVYGLPQGTPKPSPAPNVVDFAKHPFAPSTFAEEAMSSLGCVLDATFMVPPMLRHLAPNQTRMGRRPFGHLVFRLVGDRVPRGYSQLRFH